VNSELHFQKSSIGMFREWEHIAHFVSKLTMPEAEITLGHPQDCKAKWSLHITKPIPIGGPDFRYAIVWSQRYTPTLEQALRKAEEILVNELRQ
jgi:hypothetical protein